MFRSFHQVDDGAQDHNDHQHEQNEDADLSETIDNGSRKETQLRHEMRQPEDPEYAQEPQCPEYQQGLGPGEYDTEKAGNDGQQVDDPQQAENIFHGPADTDEPQDIFDGE